MSDKPIIFSGPMVRAILDGRKTQTRRVIKPSPEYCGGGDPRAPQNWGDRDAWGWENHEEGCWDLLSEGYTGRPYYAPGDRLWVREGWNVSRKSDLAPGEIIERPLQDCIAANGGFGVAACDGVVYRATGAQEHPTLGKALWRSPIHMPRWASRLTLTVTDVRVQRLQEISEEDAVAEGATSRPRCHGFNAIHDGWSMDWSQVGRPSRWGENGVLTERCVSLYSARDAFSSYWNTLHGPDAWGANPWVVALTFTVERRNVDARDAA